MNSIVTKGNLGSVRGGSRRRLYDRTIRLCIVWAIALNGCATGVDNVSPPKSAAKRAEVHAQLAWNYLRLGQYDIAREEVEKAVAADNGSSRAHHIYGLLSDNLGDLEGAELHFNRAVRLDRDNLDAAEDYAGFLCKSGRSGQAVNRYEEIIQNRLNRDVTMTQTRAGLCLLGAGKGDAAETYFRAALSRNPRNGAALSAMARISFETGRYLSGRGYVQRYLDFGPDDPQVLYYAANIERELGDEVSAQSYARELLRLFPRSREAKQLGGG